MDTLQKYVLDTSLTDEEFRNQIKDIDKSNLVEALIQMAQTIELQRVASQLQQDLRMRLIRATVKTLQTISNINDIPYMDLYNKVLYPYGQQGVTEAYEALSMILETGAFEESETYENLLRIVCSQDWLQISDLSIQNKAAKMLVCQRLLNQRQHARIEEIYGQLQEKIKQEIPQTSLYHQYRALKVEMHQMKEQHQKEFAEMQSLKERHLKHVAELNAKIKALKIGSKQEDIHVLSERCKALQAELHDKESQLLQLKYIQQ